MDGSLGDRLAVEGGAVFGVAVGDAFAGVAGQPLGDEQGGEGLAAAGGAIEGHLQAQP